MVAKNYYRMDPESALPVSQNHQKRELSADVTRDALLGWILEGFIKSLDASRLPHPSEFNFLLARLFTTCQSLVDSHTLTPQKCHTSARY